MDITTSAKGQILILRLTGKLDTFGDRELEHELSEKLSDDALAVVVDMSGVHYLSNAGLRTLVTSYHQLQGRGGTLVLANLQPYASQVMDIADFAHALPTFDVVGEAVAFCERIIEEKEELDHWDQLETRTFDCGTFRIMEGTYTPGRLHILGHVKDVLHAQITEAQLRSRQFSETEYSIGLGGLGERLEDYFPVLGEMMTIGGTMVWLPTDGHDTPDYLIPEGKNSAVTIKTAFNASLVGGFNELMMFDSREEVGTTIHDLYRALFQLARQRRVDYKGVLGLALRAQMGSVYGSGVKKSPIAENAPAGGELITSPANFGEWFDADQEPRHRQTTALICGIGVDLTADLSAFDSEELNSVFYLHPANIKDRSELLHNHGVIFRELPMPPRATDLEAEIKHVVENGDFIDMRHLLDASTITRAFIGVSYIQQLERDPHS